MTRRFYFVSLLLLFTHILSANTDPLSIKLQDNQKLVQTFSADWKQEQAIHIAVLRNKDTKMYEVLPFLLDKSHNPKELSVISLTEEPQIESLHFSEDLVTILVNTKAGQEVLDFALDGSSSTKTALDKRFEDYKLKLRSDGVTHLLNYEDDTIHIASIKNSKAITTRDRPVIGRTAGLLEELFKDNLQAIETMDFVDRGSISTSKAYLYNNIISLTKDDPKASSTALVAVNLEETSPISEVQVFNQDAIQKIKDYNSFLNAEKLLALSLSKEELKLSALPIDNPEEQPTVYNNAQLAQSNIGANFNEFLKEASRSRNASTVTTNATTDGSVLVSLSYVDKKSYQYNWWFHHWMFHNQMMWQQQMMQNNLNQMMKSVPTGFGPAPVENVPYYDAEEQIQFVITPSGLIETKDSADTNYAQIDKESYLESLDKVRTFSELSAAFLKEGYSYIYLDKKNGILELRFSNYN
ncbi:MULTISPECIES: hypothetical protein [unclassified Leeuwenhoekiella]|uniref:hypothetical protein n=1 Tax=unclassified Leeuwenhoekiella TaxID=2615029 RepID=UPI000C608012|nr:MULTISPECIES: hypothetical protein [unclassified Leeuwenhoekiella]MAW95336.1 hypothetical protein [Leeuwenhoekiella sp.]MBA81740.1 hypothetical protein [Leeuwenhoekiella sp.]|tara:strand:- start:8139 stop:9542 length:1404 start_codon:yes stop_codon:yes gene_type:complete